MRHSRPLLLSLLVATGCCLQCTPAARTAARRAGAATMMGRKFENNKLKMAKTALAYAKKASYIGKKVVVAVKSGGDDPSINRNLAACIAEANALNVPKDVVNKNIKRAMNTDTADYKELTYEAYGHGGVGLVVNCLSDNSNRANTDVSIGITKSGCKSAASGSVLFNFVRKGRLTVNSELDEDALLELAIEAGCAARGPAPPPLEPAPLAGRPLTAAAHVAAARATSRSSRRTSTGAATARRSRASPSPRRPSSGWCRARCRPPATSARACSSTCRSRPSSARPRTRRPTSPRSTGSRRATT